MSSLSVVRVYIPGIAQEHVVVTHDEEAGIADALYSFGMHFLPEGSMVTCEPTGNDQGMMKEIRRT